MLLNYGSADCGTSETKETGGTCVAIMKTKKLKIAGDKYKDVHGIEQSRSQR